MQTWNSLFLPIIIEILVFVKIYRDNFLKGQVYSTNHPFRKNLLLEIDCHKTKRQIEMRMYSMNLFKLRLYIEVLAISTGIVLLVCILPIQAFAEGKIRPLTIVCGSILWFTIIFRNETFHFLINKWFKR